MDDEDEHDRLTGLKPEERAACLIAERVLGATAHGLDRPGAPAGSVDAVLRYPDGRQAAFEVMWLADQADQHLDARLSDQGHMWFVAGGNEVWTLVVPSVAALRGLRPVVERAVRACEAAGVREPFYLPPQVLLDDEELRAFAEEGAPQLHGHGVLPSDGRGRVFLTQGPLGMFVSLAALETLHEDLSRLFVEDVQVARHFDKLRDYPDVQERHLFFPVDHRFLVGTTYDGLAFSDHLPVEPPPVPEHLTHLWLGPAFSPRVLLWSRSTGWSSHLVTG